MEKRADARKKTEGESGRPKSVIEERLIGAGMIAAWGAVVFSVLAGIPAFGFIFPSEPLPAKQVLGQPDFTSSDSGVGIHDFKWPSDIAVDKSGVRYVSDQYNNRVLVFVDGDTTPDHIIGNGQKGTSADQLDSPMGVAVWQGPETTVLFVADMGNNRVLGYLVRSNGQSTVLSDTTADYVLGQDNFTRNIRYNDGTGVSNDWSCTPFGADSEIAPEGMAGPIRVAVLDTGGTSISLFVLLDDQNPNNTAGFGPFDAILRFDILKSSFGSAALSKTLRSDTPYPYGRSDSGHVPIFDNAGGCATISNFGFYAYNINDIAVDPNGKYLYVAGTVNVDINPADGNYESFEGLLVEDLNDVPEDTSGTFGPFSLNVIWDEQAALGITEFSRAIAVSPSGGLYAWGVDGDQGAIFGPDQSDVVKISDDTGLSADTFVGTIGDHHDPISATDTTIGSVSAVAFEGETIVWVVDRMHHRVLKFQSTAPFAPGLPVGAVIDAGANTAPSAPAPVTSSDSFVQVNLPGGETTAGTLSSAADSSGTGADYTVTIPPPTSDLGVETTVIHIWTDLPEMGILVGRRSDTETIDTDGSPNAIAKTDTGRRAFAASILGIKFIDKDGNVIGDPNKTNPVGDSVAYTLKVCLSKKTTGLYHALGFDTAAGSSSFKHWYADTYGSGWTLDNSAKVDVVAQKGGGICLIATGVTVNGEHGFGGGGSSVVTANDNGNCLLGRSGLPGTILESFRRLRDLALHLHPFRWLVKAYYAVFG